MIIQKNLSLANYHTFGVDVSAELFFKITSVDEIKEIYQKNQYKRHKKMVLGEGSNVLFTRGYNGIIIKNEITGISITKKTEDWILLTIGAGEIWHQLVMWCVNKGYGGIENLALIPGTVGAAPIQNIGAYGVELKDVFYSLEAYEIKTGKTQTFFKEDCMFSYRNSIFKNELKNQYIIINVSLIFLKKKLFNTSYSGLKEMLHKMNVTTPTLKNIAQAVINIRQTKLPDTSEIGNAGSFFQNPIIEKLHFEAIKAEYENAQSYPVNDDEYCKMSAAWLIEQAGWKGYKVNKVGVYDNHSLILVNYGGGKGKDILKLANDITDSVQQKFGIELAKEVTVI